MKAFHYLVIGSLVCLTGILALNGAVATNALIKTADGATLRLVATAGSNFIIALILLAWAGIVWRRYRASAATSKTRHE